MSKLVKVSAELEKSDGAERIFKKIMAENVTDLADYAI